MPNASCQNCRTKQTYFHPKSRKSNGTKKHCPRSTSDYDSEFYRNPSSELKSKERQKKHRELKTKFRHIPIPEINDWHWNNAKTIHENFSYSADAENVLFCINQCLVMEPADKIRKCFWSFGISFAKTLRNTSRYVGVDNSRIFLDFGKFSSFQSLASRIANGKRHLVRLFDYFRKTLTIIQDKDRPLVVFYRFKDR